MHISLERKRRLEARGVAYENWQTCKNASQITKQRSIELSVSKQVRPGSKAMYARQMVLWISIEVYTQAL